ncbi:MAG: hypothetical protein GX759_00815 [Thermoanaerobacterales bacterium]|nr:hypothetical protein [Thermoanaerobacterales bacterium]
MWNRLNIKNILGATAIITGGAIIIINIPNWIWMFAIGGFLVWFGVTLFSTHP